MLDFLIFAATALVGLLAVLFYLFRDGGSKKSNDLDIPGAFASDAKLGNLGDIAKAGSLHEYLVDLHAEHGPLAAFWWGRSLTLSAASPELFRSLSGSKPFNRPVEPFLLFEPLITRHSIQYANGPEGQERHKRLRASFQGDALLSFYSVFNDIVGEYVKKFDQLSPDDHVCLNREMLHFAMSAIARTSFGDMFKNEAEMSKLREAYNACWGEMEKRLDGQPAPPERVKILEDNREIIHSLVRKAMSDREASNVPEDKRIFLDNLMTMDCSDEQLLADAVSFLVGGFHTTGNLLTWAIYFLAQNQHVQDRLAAEAFDILGRDGPVTPENAPELKYTDQVLNESLRCSVLGPWAGRFYEEDVTLKVGEKSYDVPAETPIILALGVVLQDPTIWPDPEKFDPDRFNENAPARRMGAFEPFGLAPRKCPGFAFARVETKIALAILCRQFCFELVPGPKITKVHGLVTHPSRDVEVTLHPR